MEPAAIALLVALAQERRALQRCLHSVRVWRTEECHGLIGRFSDQPVILIQAGIGSDRAHRALLTASRQFSIRGACSLGFAGGLADRLRAGNLVCPGVVMQDDGERGTAFAAAPIHAVVVAALSAAGISLSDGPLLSVASPLRTPQAKRAAGRRTGAIAVDMEAAGVAEAAQGLGISWLALKSVVDTVDEPIPCFLAGCVTPRGDLRWPRVLWNLVFGRRRRALGRLARASRQAALTIQRGLGVALATWSP